MPLDQERVLHPSRSWPKRRWRWELLECRIEQDGNRCSYPSEILQPDNYNFLQLELFIIRNKKITISTYSRMRLVSIVKYTWTLLGCWLPLKAFSSRIFIYIIHFYPFWINYMSLRLVSPIEANICVKLTGCISSAS